MWREVAHIHESAAALAAHYDSLPMQALKVTARLGKAYAPGTDGTVHLDALLAYAVMSSLGDAAPVLDKAAPYIFPIPVKILWLSADGLPLLASSELQPDGDATSGTDYWHKRFPASAVQRHCQQPNTPVTRGVFKEYRIPIKVVSAESVSAFCIGNADEIIRLLGFIPFIGKKRAQGKGLVLGWEVSESSVTAEDILKLRPVPAAYHGQQGGAVRGWCQPYWFRPWHLPCV